VSAPAIYNVRRATTDDLGQLTAVWKAAALPAAELEKRFTEFQVAEGSDGRILGAIGLQLAGADGKIHSETFADFALTDALRPLLWQRLETVARNHGLFRLWTAETAPFWKKDAGFASAAGPPPEDFGVARGPWLALRLKDESADPDLLEAQFNLFREAERAKREKLLQHAALVKMIGTALAVLLFALSAGVLVWFLLHRTQLVAIPR
jgi:N-acetylglutamate synthase-like GNAT family acetyltransferase